jgi:hypothetical protein
MDAIKPFLGRPDMAFPITLVDGVDDDDLGSEFSAFYSEEEDKHQADYELREAASECAAACEVDETIDTSCDSPASAAKDSFRHQTPADVQPHPDEPRAGFRYQTPVTEIWDPDLEPASAFLPSAPTLSQLQGKRTPGPGFLLGCGKTVDGITYAGDCEVTVNGVPPCPKKPPFHGCGTKNGATYTGDCTVTVNGVPPAPTIPKTSALTLALRARRKDLKRVTLPKKVITILPPPTSTVIPKKLPQFLESYITETTEVLLFSTGKDDSTRPLWMKVAGLMPFVSTKVTTKANVSDGMTLTERGFVASAQSTKLSCWCVGAQNVDEGTEAGLNDTHWHTNTLDGAYTTAHRGKVFTHLLYGMFTDNKLYPRAVLNTEGKAYASLISAAKLFATRHEHADYYLANRMVMTNTIIHYINQRISEAVRVNGALTDNARPYFRTAGPSVTARRTDPLLA